MARLVNKEAYAWACVVGSTVLGASCAFVGQQYYGFSFIPTVVTGFTTSCASVMALMKATNMYEKYLDSKEKKELSEKPNVGTRKDYEKEIFQEVVQDKVIEKNVEEIQENKVDIIKDAIHKDTKVSLKLKPTKSTTLENEGR